MSNDEKHSRSIAAALWPGCFAEIVKRPHRCSWGGCHGTSEYAVTFSHGGDGAVGDTEDRAWHDTLTLLLDEAIRSGGRPEQVARDTIAEMHGRPWPEVKL